MRATGPARRPLRGRRDGVEDTEPAFVGDVAPAELQRIEPRQVCGLVERLLRRERKRHVERRSQVRRFEVTVNARDAVVVQPQVRDVVHRPERVLVQVARRTVWRFVGRRPERELFRRFDRGPDVLPAVVLVRDDLSVSVHSDVHIRKVRRPVVVPPVLVGPAELHPHGLADLLRHHRRRLRRIVIAAAAERAGAFVVLHADVCRRDAEHLRDLVSRAVDALRRAHHGRAARRDVGDRAIGTERHVALVRAVIGRLDDVRRPAERRGDITLLGDDGIRGLRRSHLIEQCRRARRASPASST